MTLPLWVEENCLACTCGKSCDSKLQQALAMAVEVLKHIEGNCECCPDTIAVGKLAGEALAAIEKLGEK